MNRIGLGFAALLVLCVATSHAAEKDSAKKKPPVKKKVNLQVGDQAPEFKIKDSSGKEINLSKLTQQGPVLVRLTCGCSGCDRELAYFQALHQAYQEAGLVSLAVFREPDKKVEKYV
ncbi:MAG: peroxiredoxin family protein, partial [Planctomycetales bacterium]